MMPWEFVRRFDLAKEAQKSFPEDRIKWHSVEHRKWEENQHVIRPSVEWNPGVIQEKKRSPV